jgi:hypothetical protein
MPPRYAFWTILIDNAPTAFRAKRQEDLLPTLHQLRRTNKDVVLRWFAGGRLWASPEEARQGRGRAVPGETRGRDWRPGGDHRDPRARVSRKSSRPAGRDTQRRAQRAPAGAKTRPEGADRARQADTRGTGAQEPQWRTGPPTGHRRPPSGAGGEKGAGSRTGKPPHRFGRPARDRGQTESKWSGKGSTRPWESRPRDARGTSGRERPREAKPSAAGSSRGREPRKWAVPAAPADGSRTRPAPTEGPGLPAPPATDQDDR